MPVPDEKHVAAVARRYGQAATSYLAHRIVDAEYIGSLQERANEVTVGSTAVEPQLLEEHVYDLGGDSINDSLTVALVDPENSPTLFETIEKRLRVTATRDNTSVAYFTRRFVDLRRSRDARAVVLGRQQFLLVHHYENRGEDAAAMGVHVLESERSRTLLYKHITAGALKDKPASVIDRCIPHAGRRLMGTYKRILVESGGAWRWATVLENGALLAGPKKGRLFAATEFIVTSTEVVEEAGDKQGLPLAGVTVNPSAKGRVQVGNLVIVAGAIGIGTTVDGPSQEGAYRYGPPNSDGPAGCSNYGNSDDCKNCCMQFLSTASTAIGVAATACAVETPWPFTLICFGAAAIAQGIVWY